MTDLLDLGVEQYVSLTTFRRNGQPVPTPVWVAADGDGGLVITSDLQRIVRAGVQFVPDSSIETSETGTRHRTAERVAKQTGYPIISVSQSMRIIALYVDGRRYVLDDSAAILSRANQALATLERYKLRLDEVSGTLSALEIEDLVTVRDAIAVSQRLEMVRRIANAEILVVRGGTHYTAVEFPELVDLRIERFWREHAF